MNAAMKRRWVVGAVLLGVVGAACGGDDDAETTAADEPAQTTEAAPDTTEAPAAETTAEPAPDTSAAPEETEPAETTGAETTAGGEAGGAGLASCPSPIVLQTDWFPEPEHGALYQLVDLDAGELDAGAGRFTAPLLADPSVSVEIRAGGPFIGFQNSTSLMYQDDTIFAGYVSTDEAVRNSGELPTVAVVAPLEKNPQILMWDPEDYQFETFANIGESEATVLYFEGGSFMDYLVGAGFIRPEQLDGSYDGSPARFVVEEGLVQQEFVTQAPYWYEFEVAEWMKPIDFLLIHDSGFELYTQTLALRPDILEANTECLTALVPLVQQAQIDYVNDPVAVNTKIVEIDVDLQSFFTITPERSAFVTEQLLAHELVANGGDDTLGNFDLDRVQSVIDILVPIYTEANVTTADLDVTPEDLVTNEFVDPSIGL